MWARDSMRPALCRRSHLQPNQSGAWTHGDATDALTFYADYNSKPGTDGDRIGMRQPAAPCVCPMTSPATRISSSGRSNGGSGTAGQSTRSTIGVDADVFHTVNRNDIQFVHRHESRLF